MKKFFVFLILALSLAFASATVLQLVTVNQDTLDATGTFIGPRSSLAGASVEGYLCGDASCTFSIGTFLASTSIPGSSITIDYPTTLSSPFGYALFYTKPGFIPFEVLSTYAGTGSVVGEAVLTKKQVCTIPLTISSIQNNTNLTLTGTVTAPLSHAGPLSFVPSSLASLYQTPVTITLTLTNSTFSASTARALTLNFSETQAFTLEQTAPLNTTYNYAFTATSTDTKCLTTPTTTSTGIITLGIIPTNTPNTTTTLPLITIISPTAITYNTSAILINLSTINATSTTVSIPGALTATNYTTPFTITLVNGTYTLTAIASNSAGAASTSVIFTVNTSANATNITNKSIPGPVTNLQAIEHTNTSITWNWTNPIANFSYATLYLNGIFQGNTTATNYTALNLQPNTQYTLSLFTFNASGSGSGIPTSNISRTLSNPTVITNNTTNNNGGGSTNRQRTYTNYTGSNRATSAYLISNDEPLTLTPKEQYSLNTPLLWILLALLILLLLAILYVLSTHNNHPKKSYKMPGF